MLIYYMIGIYIAICALVGTIGMGRQIGFILSFVISLLTTPVLGLIITALSSTNKKTVIIEKDSLLNNSITDELFKLNELKEKGIISNDEFQKQKEKILF